MSDYQSNQIKLINTSLIDPHPDNPRKNIGDVSDLAASIKANGLLSPLSVVPNGRRYRVIAGHRRLAACKQAGTGAVPCFVLDLDPLQQLEAMITENCQREQLTVLEEADAIQGMLDLGATAASVAHRLGRSSDYVRDRSKAASIPAADGPHAAHTSLQTSDWPPEAVSILASRIEWFIEPSDWSGRGGDTARIIIDYYRILEDLGYEPADDETEHLETLRQTIKQEDGEAGREDREDDE